jgi:hypothetical protein
MSTRTRRTAATTTTSYAAKSAKAGTKLIPDVFKGNPTIGIWDVDVSGQPIGKAPIISFGYTKVQAIVDHMEEIRIWAAEQEEEKELAALAAQTKAAVAATTTAAAGAKPMTIDDLSPADILAIKTFLDKSTARS